MFVCHFDLFISLFNPSFVHSIFLLPSSTYPYKQQFIYREPILYPVPKNFYPLNLCYQKASTHIIVPIHYQEMSTLKGNNKPIDKISVEKKSAVELKLLANSNGDEEDAMSAVNKQKMLRVILFNVAHEIFVYFYYFSYFFLNFTFFYVCVFNQYPRKGYTHGFTFKYCWPGIVSNREGGWGCWGGSQMTFLLNVRFFFINYILWFIRLELKQSMILQS